MIIMLTRRRSFLCSSLNQHYYYYHCGCSRFMSAAATAAAAASASVPSSSSSSSMSTSFLAGRIDPFLYIGRVSDSSAVSLALSKNGANFNSTNKQILRLRACFSNNINLNHCIGNNDDSDRSVKGNGLQKAWAYAPSLPQPQLLRGSVEDDPSRVMYRGGAASQRVSCDGFSRKKGEKIVVAVDVDEVLGNFVSALNRFIADRYSSNHSVSEYHVYEFFKIWNCSRDEADIRVHEFFKTSYFKTGIYPIPGAREALQKLSRFCNLSIVTSRQNAIKDHTIEWIGKHYPGIFQEIHFGNHFALDGQSRPKSDICRSLGAQVLIDDNPRYAIECAEVGMRVLLFDYENSYPWAKMESVDQHPLVTKVHNWKEVEYQMASWVIS